MPADTAHIFHAALKYAQRLATLARLDSPTTGWRSASAGCDALLSLLPYVSNLVFDTDVKNLLRKCPPDSITPNGAELRDVNLSPAVSWHHFTAHAAFDVANKAIRHIDPDAVFLFVESEADLIEYVVVESNENGVRRVARQLKPGERHAARMAESLRLIQEGGRKCWPDVAVDVKDIGLTDIHFERIRVGMVRETIGLERGASQPVTPPNPPILWLTVSEAAAVSGVTTGEISRAANKDLKTNGKVRRERRIAAEDLIKWMLERANKPDPTKQVDPAEYTRVLGENQKLRNQMLRS